MDGSGLKINFTVRSRESQQGGIENAHQVDCRLAEQAKTG